MNNYLIITMVVLLLYLVLTLMMTSQLFANEYGKSKLKCKEAIRVQHMTNLQGNDMLKLFSGAKESDVPCGTFYEKVSGDKEEIIEALAGYLYDASDMMHRGTFEIFEGAVGSETYCILTHHISFTADSNEVIKSEELIRYMDETKIPASNVKGRDMSILDFMTPFKSSISDSSKNQNEEKFDVDFTINTEEDYGIMFVYSKTGYFQKTWAALTGSTIGSVVGGVILLFVPDLTISKAGAIVLFSAAVSGKAGYGLGNENSASWSSDIWLFPYNTASLNAFNCTYLPGMHGTR